MARRRLHPSMLGVAFSLVALVTPELAVAEHSGAAPGRRLKDSVCDATSPASTLRTVALDGQLVDLVFAGNDDQFVYITTLTSLSRFTAGSFWRSSDNGKSFRKENDKLAAAIPADLRGAIDDMQTQILAVHVNHNNNDRVLLQGMTSHNWITEDGGETYTHVVPPGGITRGYAAQYRMHPTEADWLLALAVRPCPKGEASSSCPADLFWSKDFGRTWTNMTQTSKGQLVGFMDFEWGIGSVNHGCLGTDQQKRECKEMLAGSIADKQMVLASAYERGETASNPYGRGHKEVDLYMTTDFFSKDIHKMLPCGGQLEVVNQNLYAAVPNACPLDMNGRKKEATELAGEGVSMFVSSIGQSRQLEFNQVCLPTRLQHREYSLIPHPDGVAAYVIAKHHLQDADFTVASEVTNLYAPGAHEAIYSQSLRNSFRFPQSKLPDMHNVKRMPGVIIANQQVGPDEDNPEVLDSSFAKNRIHTKISFNGGGSWNLIPIERRNLKHNSCFRCEDGVSCYLFLHGDSSWVMTEDSMGIPSVYSHTSAPGIIMATGNTGPSTSGLVSSPGDLCTWVSSDGGSTWRDVAEGPWIYEIGDSGGALIMASHNGPTDKVLISLDIGQCWRTVELENALLVENIRVEPDGLGDTFIVHGFQCFRTSGNDKCTLESRAGTEPGQHRHALVFRLDVSELTGAPDCDVDADYEMWDPRTEVGMKRCLLGQHLSFQRRRSSARSCLNSKRFQPLTKMTDRCPCDPLFDLECDYGYARRSSNPHQGECAPIAAPECPALQRGQCAISGTHQRIVRGDICRNADSLVPDVSADECRTGGARRRSSWRTVELVVVSGLLIAGLVGTLLVLKARAQKGGGLGSALADGMGSATQACAAAASRLRNAFNRAIGRTPAPTGYDGYEPVDAAFSGF